jgi:hypothetical protein
MNRRAKFAAQALKLNFAKLSVVWFGLSFGSTAAYALDGTRTPVNSAPTIGQVAPEGTPHSAKLLEWFHARKLGDIEAAWKFLEDAARDGNVGAASELGRIYGTVTEWSRTISSLSSISAALPILMPMN